MTELFDPNARLYTAISSVGDWGMTLQRAWQAQWDRPAVGRLLSTVLLAAGERTPILVTGFYDDDARTGQLVVVYEDLLTITDADSFTREGGSFNTAVHPFGAIGGLRIATLHDHYEPVSSTSPRYKGIEVTLEVEGRTLTLTSRPSPTEHDLTSDDAVHSAYAAIRDYLAGAPRTRKSVRA